MSCRTVALSWFHSTEPSFFFGPGVPSSSSFWGEARVFRPSLVLSLCCPLLLAVSLRLSRIFSLHDLSEASSLLLSRRRDYLPLSLHPRPFCRSRSLPRCCYFPCCPKHLRGDSCPPLPPLPLIHVTLAAKSPFRGTFAPRLSGRVLFSLFCRADAAGVPQRVRAESSNAHLGRPQPA